MSRPCLLQVSPSASGGGMERIVNAIGDTAAEKGWTSLVASYRGRVPTSSRARHVRLPAGSTRWPRALRRLAGRSRPDIIHLHGSAAGSLGALAVRAGGSRVLFTSHDTGRWLPMRHRLARRLAARVPRMNVAVSRAVAGALIDQGVPADRVVVVPNGVPEAPVLAAPGDGCPRFVYVANLSPWKGHEVLVRALEVLGSGAPTVDCVGDGPQRERIVAEAARRGVADRIRLTGYVDDPWKVAEGAWAYVHPAPDEGMPLALLEAMVRGLPPVAAAGGGIPEAVQEEKTGLLVPPNDPEALAGGMRRLLSDRALRDHIGREARALCLRAFPLTRTIDAYLDLYAGLLEEPDATE